MKTDIIKEIMDYIPRSISLTVETSLMIAAKIKDLGMSVEEVMEDLGKDRESTEALLAGASFITLLELYKLEEMGVLTIKINIL